MISWGFFLSDPPDRFCLRFDLDDRTNAYKPEPWIFVSPILARQQGGIFVHSGCSPLDLRGALSCLGKVWTVGRTGW